MGHKLLPWAVCRALQPAFEDSVHLPHMDNVQPALLHVRTPCFGCPEPTCVCNQLPVTSAAACVGTFDCHQDVHVRTCMLSRPFPCLLLPCYLRPEPQQRAAEA